MSQYSRNRRNRPDLLLRLLSVCNGAAVVTLAAALLVTAAAKPELETFFDRFYHIHLRRSWDMEMANYIGIFLTLSLLTSIVGLIINSKRLKRKTDFIRATLVLSLLISALSIFFYIRLLVTHS